VIFGRRVELEEEGGDEEEMVNGFVVVVFRFEK